MRADQAEINKKITENMKQVAIDKTCPNCKRKMAINRMRVRGWVRTYCRWSDCQYSSVDKL